MENISQNSQCSRWDITWVSPKNKPVLLLTATAVVCHVSHNVTVLNMHSNPEMNVITTTKTNKCGEKNWYSVSKTCYTLHKVIIWQAVYTLQNLHENGKSSFQGLLNHMTCKYCPMLGIMPFWHVKNHYWSSRWYLISNTNLRILLCVLRI
jgi:hypothetical protein